MSEDKIDKMTFNNKDFKFQTAYNTYVNAFDEAEDSEDKEQLNEVITRLHNDEISYPDFYTMVKNNESSQRLYRPRIETSRKFAYRKKVQKEARSKRHKK
jgi:hypothetical protein